jgi:hypothetical protein
MSERSNSITGRRVEPELLDVLPVEDPRAQRSRRDLQRLHRAMGTLSTLCGAIDRGTRGMDPRTMLELGAGDGSLMLRLAQCRAKRWPDVKVTMLDRQASIAPETLDGIRANGWKPTVFTVDVFDWLAIADESRWNVIWTSLFLHHFEEDEIKGLFRDVALRCSAFVCCEPRRTLLPRIASRAVGLLGAGEVTRSDAIKSVRAGFRGKELSHLWPHRKEWLLHEYPAGLFSHCFIAYRKRLK